MVLGAEGDDHRRELGGKVWRQTVVHGAESGGLRAIHGAERADLRANSFGFVPIVLFVLTLALDSSFFHNFSQNWCDYGWVIWS